jgi:hypothetical protein
LVARDFPGRSRDLGVRFGVVHADGRTTILFRDGATEDAWSFQGSSWRTERDLTRGLESARGWDLEFRDIDGDGRCELTALGPLDPAQARPAGPLPILAWSDAKNAWEKLPFTFPAAVVSSLGRVEGVRFVDLDDDGRDDLVCSRGGGDGAWGVYLFESREKGWSRIVGEGRPGDPGAIPPIVLRRGDGPVENNGVWIHSRHLWWQNEHTDALPDGVDRRSFQELLTAVAPRAK